jgi:hypothetical protein
MPQASAKTITEPPSKNTAGVRNKKKRWSITCKLRGRYAWDDSQSEEYGEPNDHEKNEDSTLTPAHFTCRSCEKKNKAVLRIWPNAAMNIYV